MKALFYLALMLTSLMGIGSSIPYDVFLKHNAVLLIIDPESGNIIDANTGAERFYGYSRKELQRMSIDQMNILSKEQVYAERQRAQKERRNYFIFSHRTADGSVKTVEVYSYPHIYENRRVLFSVIHDVTSGELAKDGLYHYKENLEALVRLRTSELEHQGEFFTWAMSLALGVQFVIIVVLIHINRRRKQAETMLKDTMNSLYDQIEEGVEKARQKDQIIAEQNRRHALSYLLVNIAHQWRQPLSAIGLLVQDLEDRFNEGDLGREEFSETVMLVMGEIRKLSETLQRFTEFYRADDSRELISLYHACDESVSLIRARLDSARVTVHCRIPEDLQLMVSLKDMGELFLTLLENVADVAVARKLASADVWLDARRDDDRSILIHVEDNAGGIPDEIRDRIFDPYSTTAFRSPGKGLGLYMMVRTLEEHYGGTVEVDAIPGGTRFTIRLPEA